MHYDYKSDVPENIDELKLQDIFLKLYKEGNLLGQDYFTLNEIAEKYVFICKALNIFPSNEQAIFILDRTKSLLCEACAGSGKTTVTQIKRLLLILLEKIASRDILSIAYNEHTVSDMKLKHDRMIMRIKNSDTKRQYNELGYETTIKTFHSLAKTIVKQFRDLVGLDSFEIATESRVSRIIEERSVAILGKEKVNPVFVKTLYKLHSLKVEKMVTTEQLENTKDFKSLGITIEEFEQIEEKFKIQKGFLGLVDFTDLICYTYEIMQTDKVNEIKKWYKYIIVDEYQDLSALMVSILRLFAQNGVSIICIGDGDQSIYRFRGADSLNCLKFREMFVNGRIYSLTVNRRCQSEIVKRGNMFIDTNQLRIEKKIKALTDGGVVRDVEYEDLRKTFLEVALELKEKNIKDLSSTYVCFRTNNNVQLFTRFLYSQGIDFRAKEEFIPFQDTMTKAIIRVLNLLGDPRNRTAIEETLWIMSPMQRKDVKRLLKEQTETKDFYEYDYSGFNYNNLDTVIEALKLASEGLRHNMLMSEILDFIKPIFYKYFWNWKSETIQFNKDLEKDVLNFFSQNITYGELCDKMRDFDKTYLSNMQYQKGVEVMSIHSLKGMEWDNGYIMAIDNNFPSFEDKNNPTMEEREEETRLMYVAITRARKNLTMYWNTNYRSDFLFIKNGLEVPEYQEYEESEDDDIYTDDNCYDEGEEETIVETDGIMLANEEEVITPIDIPDISLDALGIEIEDISEIKLEEKDEELPLKEVIEQQSEPIVNKGLDIPDIDLDDMEDLGMLEEMEKISKIANNTVNDGRITITTNQLPKGLVDMSKPQRTILIDAISRLKGVND